MELIKHKKISLCSQVLLLENKDMFFVIFITSDFKPEISEFMDIKKAEVVFQEYVRNDF